MKKSNKATENDAGKEGTSAAAFSAFLEDPPIASSLLILGLIALILAILDFGRTLGS